MEFEVPRPMKVEHEELHNELSKATKENGAIGDAAKTVAEIMHPHFEKEEKYALPPLGLLTLLAKGKVTPDMEDVLPMTDMLETNLVQMLEEHKEMVAVLENLIASAKKEKKMEYAHFAQRLILHAQTEEEIFYPASLLVGEYLRLKLKKAKSRTLTIRLK